MQMLHKISARDTPLWGVYIPKFGKIVVNFQFLGALPHPCTNGGEIWFGESSTPNFTPSVQRFVGQKTSKSPSE